MAFSDLRADFSAEDLKKYKMPVKSIEKTVTLNIDDYKEYAGRVLRANYFDIGTAVFEKLFLNSVVYIFQSCTTPKGHTKPTMERPLQKSEKDTPVLSKSPSMSRAFPS